MKRWHTTLFFFFWALAVLVVVSTTGAVVEETEQAHADEERPADQQDDTLYDPLHEPPVFTCRRDPTWKSLDFDQCQELTEWYEPDTWSVLDHDHTIEVLGEAEEEAIAKCIADAFDNARDLYEWGKCDEKNRNESCAIDWPSVFGHYTHAHQGEIVMIDNVMTEQEAYGIEVLAQCVQKHLPKDAPFFEERAFGQESDTGHGLYNALGGNYVTFLQGLLQQHLPGVVAAIYNSVHMAYMHGVWEERGFPPVDDLGIRTAEYLQYKRTGRLGNHFDNGSVFSISIALSDETDYQGGYFQLESEHAQFKVSRRSAIVFFSESAHSITRITAGERKVFVLELWENDDAPVGLPRPTPEQMDDHRTYRRQFLPDLEDDEVERLEDEDRQTDKDEL